jgi:hypothetical protein
MGQPATTLFTRTGRAPECVAGRLQYPETVRLSPEAPGAGAGEACGQAVYERPFWLRPF